MIIIVLGLAVILAVIAYNMYQENQYRKQVREQFGHSDKDALLASKTSHVRDGKESGGRGLFLKKSKAQDAAMQNLKEQDEIFAAKQKTAAPQNLKTDAGQTAEQILNEADTSPASTAETLKTTEAAEPVRAVHAALVSLEELSQVDLPWFDDRFDYLAYVSLGKPQELHTLPRLSARRRFQIIGCTMDDRFQIAEPIPGVYYQGFVMGLQAVSRNGLAEREELEQFNRQVGAFAEAAGGSVLCTNIDTFWEVAEALDNFCARVDQTIAIHLVSHSGISGAELRSAAESVGFNLDEDGTFHYPGESGQTIFSIAALDNASFNAANLGSQNYRGFSMLFDLPHVPAGEKTFDLFMDLAVKLSGILSLDLVNDKMEEVSTQWLKDVRAYVLARQDEMLKVDIKPGCKQAQRLFS